MLNIQLDDNYTLTSDESNFILNKITINQKTKEPYVSSQSFFGDIEGVLQAYLTHTTRNSNSTSIEELLIEMRTTRRYIKTIIGSEKLMEV